GAQPRWGQTRRRGARSASEPRGAARAAGGDGGPGHRRSGARRSRASSARAPGINCLACCAGGDRGPGAPEAGRARTARALDGSPESYTLRAMSISRATSTRVPVAVLGATGYTGVELLRLLARHPAIELAFLSSEQYREL